MAYLKVYMKDSADTVFHEGESPLKMELLMPETEYELLVSKYDPATEEETEQVPAPLFTTKGVVPHPAMDVESTNLSATGVQITWMAQMNVKSTVIWVADSDTEEIAKFQPIGYHEGDANSPTEWTFDDAKAGVALAGKSYTFGVQHFNALPSEGSTEREKAASLVADQGITGSAWDETLTHVTFPTE